MSYPTKTQKILKRVGIVALVVGGVIVAAYYLVPGAKVTIDGWCAKIKGFFAKKK